MSNEVVTRTGSDLTIQEDQTFWNDKQVAALRQLGVKDASNGDLAVFFHHAQRTGLDPFAKQIYMIGRWSKEGTKQTIQTGIDGFRLIARRAADRRHERLSYEDTEWCGEDGIWRDVWISSEPPTAARVAVLRNGERFPAVALWREYVQTNRDGSPNSMWGRMSANQLAKCAEALALRKAFPQDLSGIHTDDELGDSPKATVTQVTRKARPVTIAEITGTPAPEIEAAPASIDQATGEVLEPELEPEGGWPAVAAPGSAA
jgi:phage recombination protein Bet